MLDNNAPGIGHNSQMPYNPAVLAELEATTTDFMNASQTWLTLEEIETEEHAAQLADQINGLRGLWKKVDKARKEAKKPHDDAGNEVQAAFNPLLAKLKKAADALKPKLSDYANKKAEKEAEARRKAEEEAAREAAEAERAAREAEESGDLSAAVDADEQMKAAQKAREAAKRPANTSINSASGGGRTMALRKVKDVEIVSLRELFIALCNEPELHETLLRIATRRVRAAGYDDGPQLPGIKVILKEVIA